MSDTVYKVLGPNREAWHGGYGRWAQKRRWMPLIECVEPCVSGYHLCRGERQLLHWLGPVIWIAEYEGDVVEAGDKIVVGRARLVERVDAWNDRTARLFAADCAEHVLHIFEEHRPNDDRPRRAIEAARLYANGEIDDFAWAAARDAAWAAAWAAAKAAAWAAAMDAAWAAAWAAARDAASDAARDAARAAARDAAWAAAMEWQVDRLRAYLTGAA